MAIFGVIVWMTAMHFAGEDQERKARDEQIRQEKLLAAKIIQRMRVLQSTLSPDEAASLIYHEICKGSADVDYFKWDAALDRVREQHPDYPRLSN